MMLNDWEATVDLIGIDADAEWLADELVQPQDAPLSIGVFSGWGGGKSSFLAILQKKIGDRACFVRFNPWESAAEDDIRAALLTKVIEALPNTADSDAETAQIQTVKGRLKAFVRYIRIGSDAFSPLLKLLPYGGLAKTFADPILQGMSDALELPSVETDQAKPSVRAEFAALVAQAGRPIIIAVDDLDRTRPGDVIRVLESIRHFLYVPGVVVILALDRANVEFMLAAELQMPGREDIVRHYLQKFVQAEYHIPPLNANQAQAYVNLLLIKDICNGDALYETIRDAYHSKRRADLLRAAMDADAIVALLPDKTKEAAKGRLNPYRSLGELLAGALQGNPRQLKRFLNTSMMAYSRAGAMRLNVDPGVLARFVALGLIAPSGWHEKLTATLDSTGHSQYLVKLRQAQADAEPRDPDVEAWRAKPGMVEWLKLEPAMESFDLVPYLHVVREEQTQLATLPKMLSAAARSAFQLLTAATRTESERGIQAMGALPEEERLAVFDNLISLLQQRADAGPVLGTVFKIALADAALAAHWIQKLSIEKALQGKLEPASVLQLRDIAGHHMVLSSRIAVLISDLATREGPVGNAAKKELKKAPGHGNFKQNR